ncbi:MAG TPA: hypothetical protein VMH90_00505, partial [Thermoplasmata archaeon]|nr:hypothetical protein [Thermoplasmata archaeon]
MPAAAATSNVEAGGYPSAGAFEVPHRLPVPRLIRATPRSPLAAARPDVPAEVPRPAPRAPVEVSLCIPAY